VAEENEGQDTGAEAAASGVDPAAVALALGGASREDAGAFLKKHGALVDDQRELIAVQKHHLTEQFKKLRLDIWEKRTCTMFAGKEIRNTAASLYYYPSRRA
jgi:hypothetical protein